MAKDNYREIPDDKVVDLPDTPAFGDWKELYADDARRHPAKMNVLLVRYVLERFTKPGDVVLDPMAGTMNTVVQAAVMGRHAVGVEYEGHMMKWAEDTVRRVEAYKASHIPTDGGWGRAVALRGDARELSSVLKGAFDAAVFSPPYAGPYAEEHSKAHGGKVVPVMDGSRRDYSGDPENIGHKKYGEVDGIVLSPPHGADAEPHGQIHEKGRGPPLPRPGYDAAILSPPYAESQYETVGKSQAFFEEMARRTKRPAWADPESGTRRTRAAQDAEVDAVVTSPPHGPAMNPVKHTGDLAQEKGFDAAVFSPPHADTQVTSSTNILTPKNPVGKVEPAAISRTGYADAVVTSPPHGDTVKPHGVESPEILERRRKMIRESDARSIARGTKWAHSKDSEERRAAVDVDEGYSEDSDNLGNKPYGKIDHVVTSPPYGAAEDGGGIAIHRTYKPSEESVSGQKRGGHTMSKGSGNMPPSDDPANLSNLAYGDADAIVMSPPHSEAVGTRAGGNQRWTPKDQDRAANEFTAYSKDPANIGNRPHGDVDAVVTSPPYENAKAFEQDLSPEFVEEMRRRTREGITGGNSSSVEAEVAHLQRAAEGRKTTEGNIGRKSGETYLEAMARVYAECFRVVKPGGLIVVVVKNFVRDFKPVRLDEDTAKLLRWAGFEEVDHLYRKLRGKSFWVRNYLNRFKKLQQEGKVPKDAPIPVTEFEDVLVWRRPTTS